MALAACIPSGDRKPPPSRPATAAEPSKATLLCYADLRGQNVRFRPLADRYFEGGCSALGAVQLLDIGTPVANLGAMTCPLAATFSRWVRDAVQPAAAASLGSRVAKIESLGTYSCRPVNGQAGARLSEHGRANAVDVGAFVLEDGRRITVLAGWNGEDESVRRFLRTVHDSGCRRFGVVLGPDANAFHRDHLHLDLGPGPYCK
ncbi:MAG: extensin family protein [Allosphingosinicella sp.]